MKMYILHHNRYWTEYLDFLIQDHVPLVRSKNAKEPYSENIPLNQIEPFEPLKHKTIVSAGRIHDTTNCNRIILRYLHSPGFYVYTMIKAYAELLIKHVSSDYRFLVLDQYYRALSLRDIADSKMDHFRYLMMNDPKVLRIEADPIMCRIKEAKRSVPRKYGTGLLCPTWFIVDQDFDRFVKIIQALKKEIEVNMLLHPLMRLDQKYIDAIRSLEGNLLGKVYFNLPRSVLINLYDAHEFIISNGSGTCYEGMVRGCKPLTFHFDAEADPQSEKLEEIYLPFPSYQEIHQSQTYDSSFFIDQFFPYLKNYNEKKASEISKKEIIDAALAME